MTFRLSKLHGLGNDFLVLLTDDASLAADRSAWEERARHWCDRHRGIGADGLILGVRGEPDADLVMHLYNADGSRAEMSGNGIRCLAHAETRRRGKFGGRLSIGTDGGIRQIDIEPDPSDLLGILASVDMGAGGEGPEADQEISEQWKVFMLDPVRRLSAGFEFVQYATYDFGNPHLVIQVEEPDWVDMAIAGEAQASAYSNGINVHVMAPTPGENDAITVHHWERGVGVTEACGTGACAAALAAYEWQLTNDRVTVHMPGGDADVTVGDTCVLRGPSVFIADVEVPS